MKRKIVSFGEQVIYDAQVGNGRNWPRDRDGDSDDTKRITNLAEEMRIGKDIDESERMGEKEIPNLHKEIGK